MKYSILLLLFFLLPHPTFSQKDSTTLKFEYLDQDLSILNDLNDIQYIRVSCSDTNMRGKRFLLSFDEYSNGKKIMEDTSNMTCLEQKIPLPMGKDTFYEIINICDRMKFEEKDSVYEIRFAGMLQKDTFKLKIHYPSLKITNKFTGNEHYSFRALNCFQVGDFKIKLNKLTPLLAYTPPFNTSTGAGSYCILGSEEVDKWFEKFNVKHYYIINLIVK